MTTVQPIIYLTADLKCIGCGHVAAEVEGEYGRPIKLTKITPVGAPRLEVRKGEPMRCPRCAGHLHLDDVETRRTRPARLPSLDPAALRRAS